MFLWPVSQNLNLNFRKSRAITDLTGVFIWGSSIVVSFGNYQVLGFPPKNSCLQFSLRKVISGVVWMEEWPCSLAKFLLG